MKKITTFMGAILIILSFTLMAFYFLGDIRAQNMSEEKAEGQETESFPINSELEQLPFESVAIPAGEEEAVEPSPFTTQDENTLTPNGQGNIPKANEDMPSAAVAGEVEEEVTEAINTISGLKIEVPLNYNPVDYRDPFAPPIKNDGTPLLNPENPYTDNNQEKTAQTLSDDPLLVHFLKDYQVIGLIWGVKKPRAMVKLPTGRVVTISPGMRLGREGGVVRAIREKEVVFIVPDREGDYKKGSSVVLQMRN